MHKSDRYKTKLCIHVLECETKKSSKNSDKDLKIGQRRTLSGHLTGCRRTRKRGPDGERTIFTRVVTNSKYEKHRTRLRTFPPSPDTVCGGNHDDQLCRSYHVVQGFCKKKAVSHKFSYFMTLRRKLCSSEWRQTGTCFFATPVKCTPAEHVRFCADDFFYFVGAGLFRQGGGSEKKDEHVNTA